MPDTKPVILHYYHDFNAWGGIVTHLAQTLPALQKNFQTVFLGTKDSPLSNQLAEQGVSVYGFPFDDAEQKFKSRFKLQALYGEYYLNRHRAIFQQVLKQTRPHIIHTHMGEGDHRQLIKSNIPVVRTFHGSFYKVAHQGKNPIKRLYHQWCLNRFSRVCKKLSGMTIVSQYEKQVLESEQCLPPDHLPALVLPNGLNLEQFQKTSQTVEQLRQQLGIPLTAKVVGLFSRLAVDKNAAAFLTIAQGLIQQWAFSSNEELHFIVAGQGPLQGLFHQFSQQHVSFHYLGYRTDVSTLIDCCDVTVNLSLDEGFGLSVLESIAMGCPCVAYDVGGVPEILTVPTVPVTASWLIPKGDEEAFIQAVMRCLEAGKTSSLMEALKQQSGHFSLENHIQKMTDFYYQILTHSSLLNRVSC